MAELDWGRSFLMCPPDFFGVNYEINPWMHVDVQVDLDAAREQWNTLVTALRQAGAEVRMQTAQNGWTDMVFTANAGIVNGKQFIPTHFRHPERQGETRYDIAYFESQGFRIDRLPEQVVHEGVGDALPFGIGESKVFISGYGTRSDAEAIAHISRLTGAPMLAVKLVDQRLYHLDLSFTPLDDRRAIIAPLGHDREGLANLTALVPEPLILDDEEALTFCCNSVVVGKTIVMPATPVRVGRQLEQWGFNVVTVALPEFIKAGGGCRCLTLALDVRLSDADHS